MGASVRDDVVTKKELTPAQARRLATLVRRFEAGQQANRERFRAGLQRLVDDGVSPAAIARELGISRQAVWDRLKRSS